MDAKTQPTIHVVKLGGSLLDLPDLVARFEQWRARELGARSLLVVGGGDPADAVRAFDARFAIGEAKAHWLAMRAMQFNAHLVAAVVRNAQLVEDARGCEAAWHSGRLAIIDVIGWFRGESENIATSNGVANSIPHRWSFTSDSIAAHLTARLAASRLTLLKSTLPVENGGTIDAIHADERGVVDTDFTTTIRGATVGVSVTPQSRLLYDVQLVNLRAEPWTRCTVR